jgi:hypothetical protein
MKNIAYLAALVLAMGGGPAFADHHDPLTELSDENQARIQEMAENGEVDADVVQEMVKNALEEAAEHMEAEVAAHNAINDAEMAAHDAAQETEEAAREVAEMTRDAAHAAAEAALSSAQCS